MKTKRKGFTSIEKIIHSFLEVNPSLVYKIYLVVFDNLVRVKSIS